LKDLWHWRKLLEKDGRLLLYHYSGGGDPDLFWTQSDLWWLALCASLSVLTLSAWSSATVERMIRKAIDYFNDSAREMAVELDFAAIITSHVKIKAKHEDHAMARYDGCKILAQQPSIPSRVIK